MALTRVLITVKTYPTISTKYEELVCTAGFREDGSWIRIYPVQFRKKAYGEQYKKYDWVEVDLVKNDSDFRPESFRPVAHETDFHIVGHIDTDGNSWDDRRKIVLGNVYTNLTKLIAEAKDKTICTSLAVFKPREILDFRIEPEEREWSKEKLESLKQLSIFESTTSEKPQVVRKLPYKFSYVFTDEDGYKSTLMIEDWETGQLYWNCLKKYDGYDAEARACEDVKRKYLNDFARTKDLYFFLGTSQRYHYVGPNPFMIIGTFHPKYLKPVRQGSLFENIISSGLYTDSCPN